MAASKKAVSPFGEPTPLATITAADTGPEIAAALGLPPAPDASDLLQDVENVIRRFCVLPNAAYLPLAIWSMATHLANAFDAFPYIALVSPAKRCGKTRVLEVLELLCAKSWRGTSPTSAALYRMMADCPTLLLDEVEALNAKKPSEVSQAILAVLNAGHRKGATVPRCDGPKNELKHFAVYGPKAFAAIGGLPDTLADRCVCLTMQRRTESQKVARFLSSRAGAEVEPLRQRLIEWARKSHTAVKIAYEEMGDLKFLSDRDADLWMPLFAVCAVASPERIAEFKASALTLTGAKAENDVEDSLPLKLLADVRTVWNQESPQMSTASILELLKDLSDSPWGEYEFNPRKLAKMLRPFGVETRQIRLGTGTCKGYLLSQLTEAFTRYLPSISISPETSETIRMNTG